MRNKQHALNRASKQHLALATKESIKSLSIMAVAAVACALFIVAFSSGVNQKILGVSETTSTGNNYYVDQVSGSDTNSGTVSAPWKTIQKAANTVVAGDTVIVKAGTYNEKVTITRSGAAGSPITFKTYKQSDPNKGVMPDVFTYGFTINRVSYVNVSGFDITVPRSTAWDTTEKGTGIITIDAKNCEISNNYIHNTLQHGIRMASWGGATASQNNKVFNNKIAYVGGRCGIYLEGGSGVIIDSNDISHTIQHPLYPTLSPVEGPDADGIKMSGTNHLIRNNYIHDITFNDTGNIDPHIDGIQTDANSSNITFDGNIISMLSPGANTNVYTQGIYLDDHVYSNITIRNNIFQICQPINLDTVNGSTIENNVIRSAACIPTRCNGKCDGIQLANSPNAKIRNNIFNTLRSYLNIKAEDAASKTGLVVSNNGFYDANSSEAGTIGYGSSPIQGDPKFINSSFAGFNYHLQESSGMIDKGISVAVATDRDGTVRPQGATYDIGAYEFVPAVPPCVENWTCSAWTACSQNGTQTRTCTDSNSCGTTASKPATTQACVYVCNPNWTCTAWSTCSSNGTQTRACSDSNNCGTTAGKPATSQTCTPPCVENWTCSAWSTCSQEGTQTRTCTDGNNCGTTALKPITSQNCIPPCTPNWTCTAWSACSSNGTQTRACSDSNNCGTTAGKPATTQTCTYVCNPNWTCTDWSVCSADGVQTCVCTDGNNCNTTSGKPATSQTCAPPVVKPNSGLTGYYFDDRYLTNLKLTRIDPNIDFNWGSGSPNSAIAADTFSVRWTGKITVPTSGTYTLYLGTDDGGRLWIDGKRIINRWRNQSYRETGGSIWLSAGQHTIKIEYYENATNASARLFWKSSSISKQIVPQSALLPQ